ncbi:MAG TPA: endopeptidase La [Candidatus Dependentiae bacterium]|nr:endopeptidase La [Candidatus Dependentiae bacterium]HRQ63026.1 endopeptidase La [Candidatus Dependentiae bacterium]
MKTVLNTHALDSIPDIFPVIPTMDVVVFPHMIVPLLVLDEKIIKGINAALQSSKKVLLLAARNPVDNHGAIGTNDLYQTGTIATIMRLIKIPEGGIKILVQGLCKGRALEILTEEDSLHARVEYVQVEENDPATLFTAVKNIKSIAEKMASAGYTFSPDFHTILAKMEDPEKIADFILSHLNLDVIQAQKLLESPSQKEFLDLVYQYLKKEVEVAEVQEKIRNNARESMNNSQKEFYLREQLKAIKRELGDDDQEDFDKMHAQLDALNMPEDQKTEVRRQINRLERTAPESLEATVTRNYLEWVFALPWGIESEENLDISHAKAVLEEDHFGLKEIKERILDFISVRNLKQDGYAPILCFVGPPGTGKTSLGKSIAKSLNREYARISLGGVKDEAEIRGHRRTYVGAMPGRFIQALRKAGSCNPVVIIDELDKIGSDFRGDPSAAMLEVLDPQQNKTFYDNYLGLPFDLSKIMFIATANGLDSISGPLRDRMEVIELSGYTLEEKTNIAHQHLVQKAVIDTGLENQGITISDEVLKEIISTYTRESGVRQLERVIRTLCSKAARNLVEGKKLESFSVENIERFLGPRKFLEDEVHKNDQVGISNGLAWTIYGGELLKIETVLMPGRGKLLLTGQMGDVMKESAQAALSYARAHAKQFGIDDNAFVKNDLHIHIPAGAIPKDGPSAGITMLTAILSALTNRPINAHYAMTGELNLQGEVMPIGGVKEKILAAKRNKMSHVILPHKNKNDLVGLEDIAKDIEVVLVQHADEVLERVLLQPNKIIREQ